MSPDQVRATANRLEAQVSSLETIKNGVQVAAAISASPFGLIPGSLIFAPWSLSNASQATTQILLAQASARELISKLGREAYAQEFASSRGDHSYKTGWAPRTPDTKKVNKLSKKDLAKNPLTLLSDEMFLGGAGTIASLYGLGEAGADSLKKWGKDSWQKVKTWSNGLPPWAKSLKRIGKAVPYAGSILNAVELAQAIESENWWDITNYGGSAIIDIVGLVPPLALPAAIVGVVWDIGWGIGGNVTKMVQDPSTISRAATNPWIMVPMAISPILTLAFAEFD